MKIIGIDVGFARCGWSIVETLSGKSSRLIAYGVVETKKGNEIDYRIRKAIDELEEIVDEFNPEEIAIESLFYFKNKTTVINVAQMRGAILYLANKKNLRVFDYTPLQVKTAVTGYGRAEKQQVQKMVQILFKLKDIPKPDDAADAVAIAYCHINTLK